MYVCMYVFRLSFLSVYLTVKHLSCYIILLSGLLLLCLSKHFVKSVFEGAL